MPGNAARLGEIRTGCLWKTASWFYSKTTQAIYPYSRKQANVLPRAASLFLTGEAHLAISKEPNP